MAIVTCTTLVETRTVGLSSGLFCRGSCRHVHVIILLLKHMGLFLLLFIWEFVVRWGLTVFRVASASVLLTWPPQCWLIPHNQLSYCVPVLNFCL